MSTMKPITAQTIDAILPFLDAFQKMSFQCGEWPDAGDSIIPHFEFSDPVEAFVHALYDHGWIEPFDWASWQDEAQQYVDDPARLGLIDAETVRKLLTVSIRKDRFCEGHLAAMFENGHIVALLRRLKRIRAEMAR